MLTSAVLKSSESTVCFPVWEQYVQNVLLMEKLQCLRWKGSRMNTRGIDSDQHSVFLRD